VPVERRPAPSAAASDHAILASPLRLSSIVALVTLGTSACRSVVDTAASHDGGTGGAAAGTGGQPTVPPPCNAAWEAQSGSLDLGGASASQILTLGTDAPGNILVGVQVEARTRSARRPPTPRTPSS
jgi:hypothetical protein